ncbi:MAG TPA: PDZ domain-containing protein, partial [Armatimonadota bacterium]
CYSPDGTHLVYVPNLKWQQAWKRYRGGQTSALWIADLSDSSVERIPRDNSNDENPLWVGDRIYFLSDRDGPVTLYDYDTRSKRVSRVLENRGLDLKSASAGPDAIVYEQFGEIWLFDPALQTSHRVPIRVNADLPEVRPHFVKVGTRLQAARISPTGARVVVEARGEILTVPAQKGVFRNLTNTPAVMERDPSWSPDGKWIAFFSDESGEYALHLREQTGQGEVRKIRLGPSPSFYYSPTWSPDSKHLVLTDKHGSLWRVDLDRDRVTRIDTDRYPQYGDISPTWSPDSRWVAYGKGLRSGYNRVFVYSLDTGKSSPVTDGMSDARYPAFDRGGKYLYFAASTDVGLEQEWDITKGGNPATWGVYLAVLRKDLPSPLAPESDEEKVAEPAKEPEKKPEPAKEPEKKPEPAKDAKPEDKPKAEGDAAKPGKPDEKKADDKKPEPTRIDLEEIDQRILALPIPGRRYVALLAGKAGTLLLVEAPQPVPGGPGGLTLSRFDLTKRKLDQVLSGLSAFDLSANGEKLLYRQGGTLAISPVDAVKPGEGTVNLSALEVRSDPRAEWAQMFEEAWRLEREFFYDPGLHGLDLKATKERYRPYLAGLACREDLNYLFTEMLGEISVGHLFLGGGDRIRAPRVPGGLLGADYSLENGRYRFAKVYRGENWNPDLRAPLTEPGVNVKEGEYLLAVDGRDLRATDDVYAFFEATAGRALTLKVGPNPEGKGSREVKVTPISSETNLRHRAWIDANRRRAEELSGGKLAYIYLPDTSLGGFSSFNRYFYPQSDRQGAVVDERFNGGGLLAFHVIDWLRREPVSYMAPRDGEPMPVPGGISGPKAMIINEMAGSGGDYMPWLFRRFQVGPLVGKRTWGGLVGMNGTPPLMDGGFVGAPSIGIYSAQGQWEVENHGVAPDVEVELDPKAWRQGRDTQLERAVQVVLEELAKKPVAAPPKAPNFPTFQRQ